MNDEHYPRHVFDEDDIDDDPLASPVALATVATEEFDPMAAAPDASALIGSSAAMARVRAKFERLAAANISVVIQGESGTGKELAARALHRAGTRRDKPFVAINCGAFPESLMDSELFGYSRGAFTGATESRQGLFAQASSGTLFLDEIGDMPASMQARLLRVLQEGEVRPVGAGQVRSVDVRVISATHVDLHKAVEEGRFRQDLFFRLNVVSVSLPPLRERMSDVPMLVAHLLKKHGAAPTTRLTPAASECLAAHNWPGNVRELENAILHALALATGDVIDVTAFPAHVREIVAAPSSATSISANDASKYSEPATALDLLPLTEAKRQAAAIFEREYLEKLLVRTGGNLSEAARHAGLDRTNFRRSLHRAGIDPTRFR